MRFSARTAVLAVLATWLCTGPRASAGEQRPGVEERDPRVVMNAVYQSAAEGPPRAGRLRLTTTPTSGAKRERVLQVRYRADASARRSLVLVESPENMRGTGFVSVEYPKGPQGTERWLYLANLKRSTRIAGGEMSGSFLGSDLSFTDLSQPDPARFDFAMIKQSEPVAGEDCWVIRAKAKDVKTQEESGYQEVQFWISKAKLALVRMRAPLTDGKRVKYMEASDFAALENLWTARKLVIRVVQDGQLRSESMLETLEQKVDRTITDAEFTKERLELGL